MNNMAHKAKIFKILHEQIGMTPRVVSFSDEENSETIDMYIGENRPDIGLTTYSTIGLSEYTIDLVDSSEREIRVEFIAICDSDRSDFPNILATCAMNIIKNNYTCKPGTVNLHIVDKYFDNTEMKHIYFTSPFLWEKLQGIEIDGTVVNWLLAIPISDNEFKFIEENGADSFESLLESKDINVFDVQRKSIL